MAEKLIPFDFAEFCKDPSRLRHEKGYGPIWASRAQDHAAVCVVWDSNDYASAYIPREFNKLRLAAKTRLVLVRLYRNGDGDIVATTNATGANLNAPGVYPWLSEPVEIEATER